MKKQLLSLFAFGAILSASAQTVLFEDNFDSYTVGTGVDQIDEGDFFLVTGGTANINTAWVQQTAPPIRWIR